MMKPIYVSDTKHAQIKGLAKSKGTFIKLVIDDIIRLGIIEYKKKKKK